MVYGFIILAIFMMENIYRDIRQGHLRLGSDYIYIVYIGLITALFVQLAYKANAMIEELLLTEEQEYNMELRVSQKLSQE